MQQNEMDVDYDDDMQVHIPPAEHVPAPPHIFEREDIVEAFMKHGYTSSSHADVNELGRLKSICKMFKNVVERQLAKHEDWLKPVTSRASLFKKRIEGALAESEYPSFFDGIHAARILPQLQRDALSTMNTHMLLPGMLAKMQLFDNNAQAVEVSKRCHIVAGVMRFHWKDSRIVGFGAAILSRLLAADRVQRDHFYGILSALIGGMQRFPDDRAIQENAITALSELVKARSSAADMCCELEADVVAYVLAGMYLHRNNVEFQALGMELVMFLTASPKWCRGTRPLARGLKNELVDAVWLQGVETRLLQVVQEQEEAIQVRFRACQTFANMARNNVRQMLNTGALVKYIANEMQMYAAGRTIRAMAMAPTTATCVGKLCCDGQGALAQHQNMFLDAGVLSLMLGGLQSYAREKLAWPMATAASFVEGLVALCFKNYRCTAKFLNANGMEIVILSAFQSQMVTGVANFRNPVWTHTFSMLYRVLTHRESKRTAQGGADDDRYANSTDTHHQPFLGQICKRFPNTLRERHTKKSTFGITDLALLCIDDKTNVERAARHVATDEVVQQCLRLLCVCMQKQPGIDRMRLGGFDSILLLKAQNIAKSRSCFITDVLCMKVLSIAITSSHNVEPSLFEALVPLGMRTPRMKDGTQVKVPPKQVENPLYIAALHNASNYFLRFRNGMLRIVLRQCMSQILHSGMEMNADDTKDVRRHAFVPARLTELSPAETAKVTSSDPYPFAPRTVAAIPRRAQRQAAVARELCESAARVWLHRV